MSANFANEKQVGSEALGWVAIEGMAIVCNHCSKANKEFVTGITAIEDWLALA